MASRTRALIVGGAAGVLVGLLAFVAWRLVGDRDAPRSEPTVVPATPLEPRREATRPAPAPKLEPRRAEPDEPLPDSRPESHEKMVPQAIEAGWRPKVEDRPRFSKWLRHSVSLYAALHRKEMGCTYALLPEASRSLTSEERSALQFAEGRLRTLMNSARPFRRYADKTCKVFFAR